MHPQQIASYVVAVSGTDSRCYRAYRPTQTGRLRLDPLTSDMQKIKSTIRNAEGGWMDVDIAGLTRALDARLAERGCGAGGAVPG